MDKMKCESPDLTQANIARLAELFPSVVTEARGEDASSKKPSILKPCASLCLPKFWTATNPMNLPGWAKKAAIVEVGRPIRKTLCPCPQESKNWDTTENLYIEGDNLDVLKLLQESYLGKVKMIYIDPPYNTGHDFIYRDNFTMDNGEWQQVSGEIEVDEDGDKKKYFNKK